MTEPDVRATRPADDVPLPDDEGEDEQPDEPVVTPPDEEPKTDEPAE